MGIEIEKDDLKKYIKINEYSRKFIQAFYGRKGKTEVKISYLNPSKVIKDDGQHDLSSLKKVLRGKSGVYIFLEKGIPVYIGIGGKKVRGESLYTRVRKELMPSQTLAKKITKIDSLKLKKKVSDQYIIEKIKGFDLIIISVGEVSDEIAIGKAIVLEKFLIRLFTPKYSHGS